MFYDGWVFKEVNNHANYKRITMTIGETITIFRGSIKSSYKLTNFLGVKYKLGLGLWCLTPISTIFQLYHGGQFYWWMKPEYPEKTIEPAESHLQNHIKLYRVHLAWMGFELTTIVVIGTDGVGNCKSNYHTITTVPVKYKYVVLLSYIYFCERWKPTFLLYYKYNIKLTSIFHFFSNRFFNLRIELQM